MTEIETQSNYEQTNEEIIQRYLDRYSHSRDSVNGRKYGLQYFFQERYFGYKGHILDVKKADLMDYFDYLNHKEDIGFITKTNKWTTMRSFLQFCMEYYEGFQVTIPRYSVNWKTIHKLPNTNKDVILTKREIQILLEYVKNWKYQYYLIFRLFTETGMRLGEFHSINVEDLHVEERYVETVGKTGRNVYYFSRGLAKHLALYLKERELQDYDCKALFVSSLRQRVAKRSINGYLSKCTKRLGIKKRVSSHTFRRTLNTLRKKMGANREDRRILLCHKVSDINYKCYVKLRKSDFLALYDRYFPFTFL